MNVSPPDALQQELIASAANILRDGGVLAIPTDTLYGLASDAFNVQAAQRIFQLKKRPEGMALPILLADSDDISRCATDIPDITAQLVDRFWPGGLTLVFKKLADIPDVVSGGMSTVALRVPDHWVPRSLAQIAGCPITGTSANRSGMPSLNSAQGVREEFGDEVDLIIDIGEDSGGVASTVLDLSGARPRILRTGAVPLSDIIDICGDSLTI